MELIPLILTTIITAERGDGDVSMCLWTKGQDTLLPHTETISLVDIDRAFTILVTWRRFMKLCGDRVAQAPGMYPPRYRTLEFPPDEAHEELGQELYDPAKPRKPAAPRDREVPFRPLTEPEPPEQVEAPPWSVFSAKSVAFLLIGLGGVYLVCGLLDRLTGCG